jgi:quinone-modifying oxidoreductase subunit QmoB
MAEKIGIYIDKATLDPYLDLDQLIEKIKNRWGEATPIIKVFPLVASEEARGEIKKDLDSGVIDAVSIVGPSPREDTEYFDFGPKVLVDRVNLREQGVLAYKNPDGTPLKPGEETPQLFWDLVMDYINMSVIKLQKSSVPEGEPLETEKRILILGGGWTGIHAALAVAEAGYEAVLVEKEQELGGYAAKLYKSFPINPPYTQAEDTKIEEKIQAVNNNNKIKVYVGTQLEKLIGQPGQYTAVLKTKNGEEEVKVGSVVVATGWKPLDSKYLEPLGYGKLKNVVTNVEFEEMAKKGEIKRPSDGSVPKNVLFILSASELYEDIAKQEEEEKKKKLEAAETQDEKKEEEEVEEKFEPIETYKHLVYTSEVTSLTALKQAGYVREMIPDSVAYIIYEHMMAVGVYELYYKSAQDDPGIMLTKGKVASLYAGSGDNVIVRIEDNLLGETIEVEADLVVVPTGFVPTTALEPVINLEYRQGPAFPDLDLFDGYADSNYICFPYETRRTGIYAAGPVRQPMTLAKAASDAYGAALKAIQCIESVNRGVAVHPRSGDLSYPKFNFVRCTQCKRCTEECPFGALDDDEKGTPKPNIARCRRCGTCMGACPERVISFDNYSVGQIGSMITSIRVPDNMDEEGPRIIVLACENDAYPALDMAAKRGRRWSPYVRIIPVRCLGSVNTIWIADAMSKGNDGCLLLGCKYGEDYQCHFIKGSELCNRRMINIGETLDRLGVELERVRQEQVAIDDYDKIPEIIDSFVEDIIKLGPNPFKGY